MCRYSVRLEPREGNELVSAFYRTANYDIAEVSLSIYLLFAAPRKKLGYDNIFNGDT